MASDLKDAKQFLQNAVEEAGDRLSDLSPDGDLSDLMGDGLPRSAGILAGVGATAVLPILLRAAAKRVGLDDVADKLDSPGEMLENAKDKLDSPGEALQSAKGKLGDTLSSGIQDKLSQKVDEAGGLPGVLKKMFSSDDEDEGEDGEPGVGKGRRMPVQQSMDIGAPLETVYNQFTQFEMWPNFMHRVTRVSQEDETTVSFAVKIWGKTKEFKATIETQRPDERVKWKVSDGMTHTGVVTFHELGPNLTRVLLNLDVEPDGMIEKLARGARYVKRAARGDLHRFKAYVEMNEEETGAWRGVIKDGKVEKGSDKQRSGSSGSSGRRRSGSGSGQSRQTAGAGSSSRSSSSRGGSSGGQSSRRRQSH